jgi:hypothetical protein
MTPSRSIAIVVEREDENTTNKLMQGVVQELRGPVDSQLIVGAQAGRIQRRVPNRPRRRELNDVRAEA